MEWCWSIFIKDKESKKCFYQFFFFVRKVNVSSVEQIRRSLRAKLKGMTRLVCIGWHEECNRY